MDFGVLYVAFGGWHQREALRSFRSLRFFNPTIKTAIVVENGFAGEFLNDFDCVISVCRGPFHAYTDKVRALRLSPFETTLFLDADTHIRGDVCHMASLLNDTGMAACMQGGSTTINSGVLLYDHTKSSPLLDYWCRRMEAAPQHEMGFFADRRVSFGDQNILNDILANRSADQLRILDYLVYNCKDADIWSAAETGDLSRSLILHTHDWKRLYGTLPNVPPSLESQLNEIQEYVDAVFVKKKELIALNNHIAVSLLLYRAIEHFPEMHFMVDLAQHSWRFGSMDDATYWFEKATRAAPGTGYPHARYADFLHATGRKEEAIVAARHARDLDPNCILDFEFA